MLFLCEGMRRVRTLFQFIASVHDTFSDSCHNVIHRFIQNYLIQSLAIDPLNRLPHKAGLLSTKCRRRCRSARERKDICRRELARGNLGLEEHVELSKGTSFGSVAIVSYELSSGSSRGKHTQAIGRKSTQRRARKFRPRRNLSLHPSSRMSGSACAA